MVLKMRVFGLLSLLAALMLTGCSREVDNSDDHAIPPSSDAFLAGISLSIGKLDQGYAFRQREYTAIVDYLATSIQLIPTMREDDPNVTVTVGGQVVADGERSQRFPLVVGDNTLNMIVTSEDGRNHIDYEIVVTRKDASTFKQDAYFKSLNTGGGDRLGYSVAMSGTTLVVGAYLEDSGVGGVDNSGADNSAADSGAVYVFLDDNGEWVQQAYLKPLDPGFGDHFGFSVAIDGDTIVVGAPGEASAANSINGNATDNSATNTGAAYVFTRSDDVWQQRAYLKASNSALNDNFGWGVAIAGNRVAVSAVGEDSAATGINGNQVNDCGGANLNCASDSGAIYIFDRTFANAEDEVGSWAQRAYLKASNTAALDKFGHRLAMDGDSLLVGAPDQDGGISNSGAAYVFTVAANTWTQQAYLKAANADVDDAFGSSVDIWQDTLVIGAPLEDSSVAGINANPADNGAADSGAAYTFTRSAGSWTQHSHIKPNVVGAGDQFAYSVSLDVDVMVVGAPFEQSFDVGVNADATDDSRIKSGAGYVFLESSNAWTQQFYLKPSNTNSEDYFGWSAAVHSGIASFGAVGEASNTVGINRTETNNALPFAGAAYGFR